MKRVLKIMAAWLLAVLTTVIISVVFQTQNVLARLNDIGADISVSDRFSMTGYDIIHFGSVYGAFIAIAFIIAFLAGGLVFRFAKFGRSLIYSVAGGVAMLVMLMAMKQVFFGIHLVHGASDTLGISMQILAGAIGGFIFARVSRKFKHHSA